MTAVLFVCTGNICRSPTAEGLFRDLLQRDGLDGQVRVDSCGLQGYHVGESPDPRAQEAAGRRGIDLSDLVARQFRKADFERFDYILGMDGGHISQLERSQPKTSQVTVARLMDFADRATRKRGGRDVGDPYYGGRQGFETVLDQIEAGCRGLLDHLKRREKLGA